MKPGNLLFAAVTGILASAAAQADHRIDVSGGMG